MICFAYSTVSNCGGFKLVCSPGFNEGCCDSFQGAENKLKQEKALNMHQFISWINLFTTTKWVVICSNALINCIFQDLFLLRAPVLEFLTRPVQICLNIQALLILGTPVLRETDEANWSVLALHSIAGEVPRILRSSDSWRLFRFPLAPF